jgi:DNA-binding NarL/FixJ family response regulator
LEELDEKYQSMLFLYNLLEDKKKEIVEMNANSIAGNAAAEQQTLNITGHEQTPAPKRRRAKPSAVNPKHKEILKLANEGQKPAEIAKELNMGQGEVRLILDLAKMH